MLGHQARPTRSHVGYLPLSARRWVAERTLAWLGRWRRLAREYEELPEVSETMVELAMIRLMLHRLAHPSRKRLPAP
jgi:putative transposase